MSEPALAFVVIGLNEGPHLRATFAALTQQGVPRERCEIIYVDSGSGDDSVAIARRAGVDVLVEIPRATASAARARNAGLARVRAPLVHFVDGDTELRPGWAREAMCAIESSAALAGVEGGLEEARPDHSFAHRVLKLEWPSGADDPPFLGGNALYRTAVVRDAGGFDERLRLGEDPELGVRLRRAGWRLHRLDRVMASHDLDLAGWRGYWRQSVRNGLSCGLVVRTTGGLLRGYWRGRLLATLAWSAALVALPVLLAVLAPLGLAAWALCAAVLVLRKAAQAMRAGKPLGTGLLYGVHTYFSKLPATVGLLHAYATPLAPRAPRQEAPLVSGS
jgi:cellulose synthase/poly-beta-1,6-N-acetylglucosamine synthase-like glycosyltransferase